jgi:hypothetical protein
MSASLLFKTQTATSLERPAFISATFVNCLLAFCGQAAGIGSSYMFGVSGAWLLLSLLVNDAVSYGARRDVAFGTYILGLVRCHLEIGDRLL